LLHVEDPAFYAKTTAGGRERGRVIGGETSVSDNGWQRLVRLTAWKGRKGGGDLGKVFSRLQGRVLRELVWASAMENALEGREGLGVGGVVIPRPSWVSKAKENRRHFARI